MQVSRIESGKFNLNIQKDVDIHSLILQVIEDIEKKYMYTQKSKIVSIVFVPYNEEEESNNHEMDNSNIISEERDKDEKNDNKNSIMHHPLYIECDPQKISQIVFNLLDNAVKFTAEGQITVSTSFQRNGYSDNNKNISESNNIEEIASNTFTNTNNDIKENKNSIVVTIVDTGTGINTKIKDQLFEKFATRSAQGTGLGLYLSKKIVEAHRGKIWYEDPIENVNNKNKNNIIYCNKSSLTTNNKIQQQKKGAIFRFILPVVSI